MLVLGIDTSGYANAIGVVDGERVLADFTFQTRNESLARIMLNIDSVLGENSLSLEDIGGFGVGLGPGSWTGIRIGVTVGKMLTYCTGRPAKGISTLEALAFCAGAESGKRMTVSGCLLAKSGGRVHIGREARNRRDGGYGYDHLLPSPDFAAAQALCERAEGRIYPVPPISGYPD